VPRPDAGQIALTVGVISLLAYMGSFLARELMENLTEHGRARKESDRRAGILSVVAEASGTISTLGHSDVFEAVVDAAIAMGMDGAAICLIDPGGDSFTVASSRGVPEGYGGSTNQMSGVVQQVMQRRDTVMTDYATLDDGISAIKAAGFRSTLASPVTVEGGIAAVLVGATKDERVMSPEDVEGFKLLASQAGRALENATKYQELERADLQLRRSFDERERAFEERDALEAQLRQAQKMEAVGQLAGGIAHDFNNLLAVIQNYADFAKDGLDEDDPRRRDMDEIGRAGSRASDLVRKLLTFSRRDLARSESVDLNDIVGELEPVLGRMLGESITLDVVAGTDAAWVFADPGQLEQVLINLSVNARDAMPDGGKLTIEVCSTRLDEDLVRSMPGLAPGPHAVVSVRDEGEGMPEGVVARAFEPFFTTKDPGKGTGLGLAMVYGIVRQHEGYVELRSEVGLGTTIDIYLPLNEAEAAVEKGSVRPVPAGGSESILVVEDEPSVREVTRRILSHAGYRVEATSRPVEALDILQRRSGDFDLLITDIIMPELSGTELSRSIRKIRPELRTLFMSGYSDEIVSRKGVLNGRDIFVQKPFTREELLAKVREALVT
jgi:signal transduction histidine kinase